MCRPQRQRDEDRQRLAQRFRKQPRMPLGHLSSTGRLSSEPHLRPRIYYVPKAQGFLRVQGFLCEKFFAVEESRRKREKERDFQQAYHVCSTSLHCRAADRYIDSVLYIVCVSGPRGGPMFCARLYSIYTWNFALYTVYI